MHRIPALARLFGSVAIAALAALPAAARAQEQEAAGPEVVTATWPGGELREEREVVRRGGVAVAHGACRLFYENGQLAAEGKNKDGEREGGWRFLHPDGSPAAEGSYAGSLRVGRWSFSHRGGAKRAAGRYLRGMRVETWQAWDASGKPDPTETGEFLPRELDWAKNKPQLRGQERDGLPHGRWTTWWRSGAPQIEGAFAAGERIGPWRFHHPQGTLDPALISGVYSGGQRARELDPLARPDWLNEDGFAELADPSAASLALLAELKSSTLSAADERRYRDELASWRAAAEDARAPLEAALLQRAHAGVPLLVNALVDASVRGDEGLAEARGLASLLTRAAEMPSAPALFPAEPAADAGAAAWLALRWSSLARITADRAEFWNVDRVAARQRGAAADLARLLLSYVDHDVGLTTTSAADAWRAYPSRALLDGSGAGAAGSRAADQALTRALDWLVRHQSPDGSWDNDGYSSLCSKTEGPCDGAGHGTYDIGVTGLAVLALLGAGSTEVGGAHTEAVKRAVAWLCQKQGDGDPIAESTALGYPEYLYGHAIAAQALCEAAAFTAGTELRPHAERAVRFCLAAQNPGKGWKHAVPPDGKSDTSVTAWMVAALAAARRAGIDVPGAAFDGAIAWIVEATNPSTGRIGFEQKGSTSARMTGVNDHFPAEKTEAMTAAGLYVRLLCGQRPGPSGAGPTIAKHHQLLERRLPAWDPEGFSSDFYYWFFASQALFHVGGEPWSKWQAALEKAVVPTQRTDGCSAGSWDPIDAWGMLAGRAWATATLALALEAGVRQEKLAGEAKK